MQQTLHMSIRPRVPNHWGGAPWQAVDDLVPGHKLSGISLHDVLFCKFAHSSV